MATGSHISTSYDVVVVGAGQGGAQTAMALRQQGFGGSIALIGDEPELPYERPPLSKDYLSGAVDFERMLIHPAESWREREVDLLRGRRVTDVDVAAHQLHCNTGEVFSYRQLVWAGGGSPRALSCPGHNLPGVHKVRTRSDVDRIRTELESVSDVVIVGGGYIGLETAAVLNEAGKHITVLEAQDRVLARVAGEPLSRFYEGEHQARGVDIRFGVTVDRLEGDGAGVRGVRLTTGEILPCDLVIVGIGIVPAVEPLLTAGAAGVGGVEIDGHCRTSLPDVFALGDCALHHNQFASGSLIRLESVQNANDQAAVVAKVLSGHDVDDYAAVPWFWSKQYDLRLQTIGLSIGHDETVLRGDPTTRRFSVIYLREGRVIALDCVNAVRDFVQGKRLVVGRAVVDKVLLADTTIALKTLEF